MIDPGLVLTDSDNHGTGVLWTQREQPEVPLGMAAP